MQLVTLGDMGKAWLQLQFVRLRAAGELSPRLFIEMQARVPLPKTYVQLHYLRGKLHFANELIGEGFLSGGEFSSFDNGLTLEVPLSRDSLHYVADHMAAERVELRLDLSGWLHVRWEASENENRIMQTPEPGEWAFVTFGQSTSTALMIQIARSDWFKDVMEPVGTLGYVVTEIPLPKGSGGIKLRRDPRPSGRPPKSGMPSATTRVRLPDLGQRSKLSPAIRTTSSTRSPIRRKQRRWMRC